MRFWPFSKTTNAATRAEPMVTRPDTAPRVRSYRAAKSDRIAGGFGVFPTTPRDELRREIRGLVGHSRHAAQNFDYARAYEMLTRRHVIGFNGIRLQMDVRDPGGKKDVAAGAQIESAWARWGKMKNSPTPCGRLSWWGVECQVATGIAREGGSFVRIHQGTNRGRFGFQVEPIPFDLLDLDLTGPTPGGGFVGIAREGGSFVRIHQGTNRGRFGFQVEPIPFDLLDLDLTGPTPGGGFVESGVEFDATDRVVAYHMWSAAMSEGHRPGARRRLRIPAAQMLYVLVPEEIGQALGVPRSATALRLMNLSEKFQESALTAANYGASNMVFFERAADNGVVTGPEDDAQIPIDQIEAGTLTELPPGVKAVSHNPAYPDAAVGPFLRQMGTSQAAGLGVSYETLTADLSGANFSSLRAGKGEEREEWRMLQRAVFEGLHDRVFSRWLPLAMLSGEVRLPLAKLDKFDAATWRPRGWPSVNPKDDATAHEKDLKNGVRTRTEICAERGRDFADVVAEAAAERQMMRDAGLDPDAPLRTSPPETPPDPGEEIEGKDT
ncbi:portal protein [Dinoroseobacter phage vB_DshS-R4C]|uniref:Portal protein n=1 Tax=Dinoroseobacter phage vB_DshS-R4C TaxID=2590919 RepID=A0ACD6BAB1_9CAUD|nr:Chain A, Portal protein [Dinoroseobacter phage vB_DshS-R4C]8GTD_B Chain B, Portal protein [Dinoroseobacter phage vB_DshS-R4C]8GTD_C Chain C, Portal protein [Dinoroseobacter phage vB_DshS-R4C]8GTD_D Chain D, Portal protein [Dinoroseobacter phage vB_DshS-R4C]8GTD_E Chain E, Portal protein [Dinoroseobacter phage vB_DshS-R4C]8GTD_F Chain F, Portal protein [Dinoroseobacter phage vB_DshS-R4C]8GTD_G Chain G, Portal protein [Dinoroseobacter phage vB_DshS-R4C]8GTD_H Chain H, Portal protein [Dinoro